MSYEGRAVTRAFAAGDRSLRDEANAVHRRHAPVLGIPGTPEQAFMAKVGNPHPDPTMLST